MPSKTVTLPIDVVQGFANLLKMGKELAQRVQREEQKKADLQKVVAKAVEKLAAVGSLRKDLVDKAKKNWTEEPVKLAEVISYMVDQQKRVEEENPQRIGTPVKNANNRRNGVSEADARLAEMLARGF